MSRIHESNVETVHPTVTTKSISSIVLPEHDTPISPDFPFYRQRFLKEGAISYDDLRRSIPERFDLSKLDEVFLSWNTSWQSVTGKSAFSLENQNAFISVELEHDHHVYRSDVKVTHVYRNSRRERMLTIKLPNNGFIYPHPHELTVFKSAEFRHRSNTYVKLDAVHLAQFPHMLDFARAYLSSASVSVKMFYDFSNDAFDFKVYNVRGGADSVCFSFHHLDTLDHEFDEDYWLDA